MQVGPFVLGMLIDERLTFLPFPSKVGGQATNLIFFSPHLPASK